MNFCLGISGVRFRKRSSVRAWCAAAVSLDFPVLAAGTEVEGEENQTGHGVERSPNNEKANEK